MIPYETQQKIRDLAMDYADARAASSGAGFGRLSADELTVRSERCVEAWSAFCDLLRDLELEVSEPSADERFPQPATAGRLRPAQAPRRTSTSR